MSLIGKKESQPSPSFFKNFLNLSLVTFVSRIFGMLREIFKAYFLGVSYYADAFAIAFSIPNLFRRLTAEGATLNAFIPALAEVNQKEGKVGLQIFFAGFTTLYLISLVIFSSLFLVFSYPLIKYVFVPGFEPEAMELTHDLILIMFFYLVFISLSAICQGLLNFYNLFVISALTPILLNISIILCAWFFSFFFANKAYGFAIGVILGGVLQFFIQVPQIKKMGFYLISISSLKHPQIKTTLKWIIPGVFGAGIYQINIVVSHIIASQLEEGSVSALSFSNRLQEFALGIFVISITTILLPELSKLIVEKKQDQINSKIQNAFLLTTFITFPATLFLFLESETIVKVIFQYGAFGGKSVMMTTQALMGHSLGVICIGINRIFITLFQASKLYKLTVKIALIVMILNLLMSFAFGKWIGHEGIAYANSLSQLAQIFLFIVIIRKVLIEVQIFSSSFWKSILKQLFVLGVVGLAIFYVQQLYFTFLQNPYLRILFQGFLAVSIYGFFSYFLKIQEFLFFFQLFSKKKQNE